MTELNKVQSRGSAFLLLLGIFLIATNLRAPFTGLAPVLELIQFDYGLNTLEASILTSLPLLAFAIISPLSTLVAKEYGLERTLFTALLIIAIGILIRSIHFVWCLYLGSIFIGSGIALGNVLLPSLVKRDFPHRVVSVTGAYALTMGIAAAACSSLIIPFSHQWGWQIALGSFIVLPLLTCLVWLPQLKSKSKPSVATAVPLHTGSIWRSALAWQITLYLGLNSTVYYIAITWLPAILKDSGLSAAEAASQHGILQLATAIPGLVLAPILYKMQDQRLIACISCIFSAIALFGYTYFTQFALVWSMLFGFGTGAGIILGLTFISLRTQHVRQAAELSGMSQCLGYLMAVIGPIAMGLMHDALGEWHVALYVCIGLALVAACMGLLAGKNIQIKTQP